MLPILNLGPLAVRTPLLLLLLAYWVATLLIEREALRIGRLPKQVTTLLTTMIVVGAVGGRLVYAIRFWQSFQGEWWSFISPNPATIDGWGGVMAAVIAAAGVIFWYRLPLRQTLDAHALGLVVILLGIGGALLASGSYYGQPTAGWGLELWGTTRQATQLYLMGAAGMIGLVLWWLRQKPLPSGSLFLLGVFLTAVSLLIIESFRGDSILLDSGIRLMQPVYLIIGLTAMVLIHFNLRTSEPIQ